MNGVAYIIAGVVILTGSTAGMICLEILLAKRKKQIRERTYQIYEEAAKR